MLISGRGRGWKGLLIVPLTVYLDDSGTSPSQQVACATALIIPAPRLILMEREWENLKTKEGFSDFHVSEYVARNHKSEFAKWDDAKHKRVYRRVCEITKKYVVQIFSLSINKPDYDGLVVDDLRDFVGRYHYSWALRHVLKFAQRWRLNIPNMPPYEWVFDFMQLRDPARIEVEEILEQAEAVAEVERGVKGDFLNYSFRQRRTLAGLQCADLVAWTNYQFALEKFKGTPLNPFARESWEQFRLKPVRRGVANFPDSLEWNFSVTIKKDHLQNWVEKETSDGRYKERLKTWRERKKVEP